MCPSWRGGVVYITVPSSPALKCGKTGTIARTQRRLTLFRPDATLRAADSMLTSRPVLSAFTNMVRRAGQTGGLRLLPFIFPFGHPSGPAGLA